MLRFQVLCKDVGKGAASERDVKKIRGVEGKRSNEESDRSDRVGGSEGFFGLYRPWISRS